jgi:hypothetical protein
MRKLLRFLIFCMLFTSCVIVSVSAALLGGADYVKDLWEESPASLEPLYTTIDSAQGDTTNTPTVVPTAPVLDDSGSLWEGDSVIVLPTTTPTAVTQVSPATQPPRSNVPLAPRITQTPTPQGPVTTQGNTVTIIGTPPSDRYVQWVNTLPDLLNDPRVTWDLIVTFAPLGPITGSHVWMGTSNTQVETESKDGAILKAEAKIYQVTINEGLDTEDAIEATYKEVFTHYVVAAWWLDNQGYIGIHDKELQSFIDGMGYMRLKLDYALPAYPYLVAWNGTSRPTCVQLQAIQTLYEDNRVRGTGVENLLVREGCK